MTLLDQRRTRGAPRCTFVRDHRGQIGRPGTAIDEYDPMRQENCRQPNPVQTPGGVDEGTGPAIEHVVDETSLDQWVAARFPDEDHLVVQHRGPLGAADQFAGEQFTAQSVRQQPDGV